MRASLSLHLSLYRKQKAMISSAVEGASSSFRAYEARYRRRTATFHRALSPMEVERHVTAADVVYVGDYHTLRLSQQSYLRVVEMARATGRRVVLAIELVEGRHQSALDAYLAGRLSERTFLARIGHAPAGGFDLWPGFRPVLEAARAYQLSVVAIDRRAKGGRSLQIRDAYAAGRIARAARSPDRPLVLVLMGQFHVAPCHLPREVEKALGENERRHLVVYQNCEGIYWKLARRGLAQRVEAVLVREGELCLLNASPLVCQQSFLDYLEAEGGDEQLEHGTAARFRELARLIGRFAGVDVRPNIESVEVATVADDDFLERVRHRGQFDRRELTQLRRHVLSRESYYIPRARLAYLATLSLNHAAEEAAHFVRHCAVGEALEAPRRASDAFYARCLEEAFGFFGSKLVNARRRCRSITEWAEAFERRRGEDRQIAAFVLAHKAAEGEGPSEAAKLLPLREDRLFHAVSHALGYLLGEAMYGALESERISRADVRALFRDALVDPPGRYFSLVRRLRA